MQIFKKEIFNRIYSNCRRGMLELDIVLINFLEKEYIKLNKNDIKNFINLLNESDINLYNWIIKNNKPNNKKIEKIVNFIIKSKNTLFN